MRAPRRLAPPSLSRKRAACSGRPWLSLQSAAFSTVRLASGRRPCATVSSKSTGGPILSDVTRWVRYPRSIYRDTAAGDRERGRSGRFAVGEAATCTSGLPDCLPPERSPRTSEPGRRGLHGLGEADNHDHRLLLGGRDGRHRAVARRDGVLRVPLERSFVPPGMESTIPTDRTWDASSCSSTGGRVRCA